MRTILKAIGLSPVFLLAIVAAAAAHIGQVTHISCGELDASVTSFPQGQSVVTANVNYDGGAFSAVPNPAVITGPSADITQGWRANDWASHKVGVYFSWTADGGSKTPVRYAYVSNCGPITGGVPGPVGPAGPVGPKGDPGVAGKDGITTTITITLTDKKPCSVSHRKVHLRLPKAMSNVKAVRAILGGRHRILPVRNGKVTLNFSGMRCGQYAVRLIKQHVGHVQLLYTLGGERDGGGNVTAYNLPPRI